MKCLFVDDEPEALAYYKNAVAFHDVEATIETAGSGEEALAKVVNQDFDLVTLDICMPGASGLEILTLLRNMCPHAVIAIISGHIPDDLPKGLAGCADIFLRKPLSVQIFGTLLEQVAHISESLNAIRALDQEALSIAQS